MKENDVRVGNFINKQGVEKKIENIWHFKFFCLWEPIPLTEEWLLKLNAEEDEGAFLFFIRESIYPQEGKYYLKLNRYGDTRWSLIYIFKEGGKYKREHGLTIKGEEKLFVHQLQNIYFDFKGEELSV